MINGTPAVPLNFPKCYQVLQWPVTAYFAMAINKITEAESQNCRHRFELELLLGGGVALGQWQEGVVHLCPLFLINVFFLMWYCSQHVLLIHINEREPHIPRTVFPGCEEEAQQRDRYHS